jgi:septal ring factor EnvC (AmiA/AmiB activator)
VSDQKPDEGRSKSQDKRFKSQGAIPPDQKPAARTCEEAFRAANSHVAAADQKAFTWGWNACIESQRAELAAKDTRIKQLDADLTYEKASFSVTLSALKAAESRERELRARFSDLAVEMEKHSNDHIHDKSIESYLPAAVEGVCADRIKALFDPPKDAPDTLSPLDDVPDTDGEGFPLDRTKD